MAVFPLHGGETSEKKGLHAKRICAESLQDQSNVASLCRCRDVGPATSAVKAFQLLARGS